MAVRVFNRENIETAPTKLRVTAGADHLVAAFCFLDRIVARWTRFSAESEVHQIFSFVLQVSDPLFGKFCSLGNHCDFTAFKGMELFLAVGAKLEIATRALAKQFHFVYLGGRLTIQVGTPTEVFHAVDRLTDTKAYHFLY